MGGLSQSRFWEIISNQFSGQFQLDWLASVNTAKYYKYWKQDFTSTKATSGFWYRNATIDAMDTL